MYGYGADDGAMQVWIDTWSADDDRAWPEGARGVVCERHGRVLSAPQGWDLVDRRDTVPRLFLPRPVLVHSRPEPQPTARASDGNAASKRRLLADLPAPQLFADLRGEASIDEPEMVDERATQGENVTENSVPDDGSVDEPDDSLSSLLDATGPLLRRAFGKRNVGPRDASKELMRPTTHHIVDESA